MVIGTDRIGHYPRDPDDAKGSDTARHGSRSALSALDPDPLGRPMFDGLEQSDPINQIHPIGSVQPARAVEVPSLAARESCRVVVFFSLSQHFIKSTHSSSYSLLMYVILANYFIVFFYCNR